MSTNKLKKKWSLLLVVFLTAPLLLAAWHGEVKESNSPQAIQSRIEPVGTVIAEGEMPQPKKAVPVALGPDAGKKRYAASCKICHAAGVAGAPKFQDKADWEPRMAVGIEGLLASSIKGKGGMPPKGTCMSCSDEELKAAIEYMLPSS